VQEEEKKGRKGKRGKTELMGGYGYVTGGVPEGKGTTC